MKRIPPFIKKGAAILLLSAYGAAFPGCSLAEKAIDERFLNIAVSEEKKDISNTPSRGETVLKIKMSYGESAWSVSELSAQVRGKSMFVNGLLTTGKIPNQDFYLSVPPDVDEVFFISKKIWQRPSSSH